MKIKLTLQCPDCGEKFSVVSEKGAELPKFCLCCGSYVGGDPDFVPSKMNIGGSAIARSVDQTYRQYEQASIEMAEAQGNPNMKITNMRDNLREGDVAAIAPQPSQEYKQMVGAMGEFNPWQGNIGGISTNDALALTKNGRERGTGARALEAIQSTGPSVPVSPVGMRGSWGGA